MLALINAGDEVVVFSPYWVSYDALVRLAEGTPVMIKGGIETDFKVTAAQLEKAITKKQRLLFSLLRAILPVLFFRGKNFKTLQA